MTSEMNPAASPAPAVGPRIIVVGNASTLRRRGATSVSGMSVAVEHLVREMNRQRVPYVLVDISGSDPLAGRRAAMRRVIEYLGLLIQYAGVLGRRRQVVYLAQAQSWRGFLRDVAFIWLARLARHRIVLHLHGGNYDGFYEGLGRIRRAMVRRTLRQASRLIVLSERLRSVYSFDTALGGRIAVVPNGIPDPLDGQRFQAKRLPESTMDPVEILFLSNLIESKGYLDVIDAGGRLVAGGWANVRLHFCGQFLVNPGDDARIISVRQAEELFWERVRAAGLEGRVEFHGVVTGGRKLQMLQAAHFVVLPTYYENEGQPICLIEAAAFGCVAVATDFRGIADVVLDGQNGALVPPRHPESVARAIETYLSNPTQYSKASAAARAIYLQGFTCERYVRDVMAALA